VFVDNEPEGVKGRSSLDDGEGGATGEDDGGVREKKKGKGGKRGGRWQERDEDDDAGEEEEGMFDQEDVEGDRGDDNEEKKEELEDEEEQPASEEDEEKEHEEDDDDDETSQPRRRVRDLMEDVALESHRFFHRLENLEESEDLETLFRRLLDTKDPQFIKYLLRRYANEDDGGASSESDYASEGDGSLDRSEKIAKRRELKEQNTSQRRERDRLAKGERDFGRKVKSSMRARDD
jgi:hypothetical protein